MTDLLGSGMIENNADVILFAHAPRQKLVARPEPMQRGQLRPIQQRLVKAIENAQRVNGAVPLTDAADRLWRNEYPRLTQDHPGALGVVVNRAEAHVLRLAMHYALLDCHNEIDAPHLSAALAAWDYCFQSAAKIFGSMQPNPNEQRVIDALTRDGELSLTEISRSVFGGNESKEKLHPLLTSMIERNLIVQEVIRRKGGGRLVTMFSLSHNELNEIASEQEGVSSYNSYGVEKDQDLPNIDPSAIATLTAEDFNMESF